VEGLRPVGSVLPEFSLPQAGGFRVTLSGLRKAHKAVLVYVGAWDQAESRADLPVLRKLSEQLQLQEVGVVAVIEAGSTDSLQSAARSAEIRFPLLRDETGAVGRLARLTETRSAATYLIDAEGRILWAGKRPDAPKIIDALPK
jgi:peroxiredoxin